MLNKIIRYSIRNRIVVILASVALMAAGVLVSRNMEVDIFPDLNAPTVTVLTEAPGLAPEEVEKVVTFPLETALNGATDVRRVRSSSTTGFSVLWVEFDWGTDIYKARQIVSEKLSSVSGALPANVGSPTLGPQSSILGEMLIVSLTSDSVSLEELRTIADWTIRPRLLSTAGVAQATVIGGDIREYQVLMNSARMKYYGVTLDEIARATEGFNQNASGGVLYQWGNEYIVRGVTATDRPEEMARAVVKTVDGQPITLDEVATVRTGGKTPLLGLASEKGRPAVLITVTKQPATGTIELTEKLDASLADLASKLPAGVHVSTDIFRQADFIESSIDNVQKSLFEGGLFVVVVLFLFLMSARTTLISLVALPLSLLTAVLVLKAMGQTINTMSLGGMAIAIGSLVDDAIIDVENVYKRLRENHALPPGERRGTLAVVFDASVEIRSSVVHATIITIVAFLPLFFLSGMEGRMLRPLGVSFIVSLFASMVVAVTITPVLCSLLLTGEKTLRKAEKEPPVSAWLKRRYRRSLEWVMRRKRAVLTAVCVLLVLGVSLFFTMGRSFLPGFNEGSLTINIATQPGVSLPESDRIGRTVEEILLTVPEIRTVARKTGRAELDEHALGVNASELEAPFVLEGRSRAEFMADVRRRLSQVKGISVEIGQPISHRIDAMLSGTKANIAIKLFGDDLNRMFAIGRDIRDRIASVEGIADLTLEPQVERPQLQIVPRRDMLAKYGIPLSEFAEFVETSLSGRVVSQVYDQGRTYDVTLKADDASRASIESIAAMYIDSPAGKVPLEQVAEIRSAAGPNTISRENVRRKIVISANVSSGDLRGVVNEIQRIVSTQVDLPQGYHVEYGGQFESEQQASNILSLASLFSLVVIFLLLYQEFRSVKLSCVILLNMPFALIGGVAALWFSSGIISIPAIIGFISLLGIATRNGILLVSRYNHLIAQGEDLHSAVMRGSMDRLNPILMTALTSALALVPLALGGDLPGNEIQSPMAKVILGGLLTSTLLNVFVVPVVYTLINRKNKNA